jgi:hypothetical protein
VKEILGEAKTVRKLLGGSKYTFDYYQREYKWETKQISELMDDLSDKFLGSHDPANERTAVADYEHYFLGSIVVSRRDGASYVIDGQQRLTTLTLLLIYLNNRRHSIPGVAEIQELIFSEKYGERSFNIDVEQRAPAMDALFQGQSFDATDQPESVANIVARYQDIEGEFPEALNGAALPFFVDWLIENVHLVEITTGSDKDAYTIFETMNDRGLSLSPTDMLKGYLLSNINSNEEKARVDKVWKKRIGDLNALSKDEDADFIKAWLRSQYAATIRRRQRGAVPEDFDLIGTEFHRWVRDHTNEIGLSRSQDFIDFVNENFTFYSRQYEKLRKASMTLVPGLESVFYNAQLEYTLQYPVLLAPLRADDSDETVAEKLRITGSYLEILVARRIWNFRAFSYSTMQYAMWTLIRDIRGRDVDELGRILRGRLDAQDEGFRTGSFFLHQQNRRPIQRMLARMTDYVEVQSGQPSHLAEYIGGQGNNRYEVEHIWADKYERHEDEFTHTVDFDEYRNRIGDLLLLPKSFNASYGALEYEQKLPHYFGQNLLAQSLNEQAYAHNPGFRSFIEQSGLPFGPHPQFKKADIEERQLLYELLAEEVWSADRVYSQPVSADELADLGLLEEDDDDETSSDEDSVHDRSYWADRVGGEDALTLLDGCIELLRDALNDDSIGPNYRKRYVGVSRGGKRDNFVVFWPRRKAGLLTGIRLPRQPEYDESIESAGLDLFKYRDGARRYILRVRGEDLRERRDTLQALARAAGTE